MCVPDIQEGQGRKPVTGFRSSCSTLRGNGSFVRSWQIKSFIAEADAQVEVGMSLVASRSDGSGGKGDRQKLNVVKLSSVSGSPLARKGNI